MGNLETHLSELTDAEASLAHADPKSVDGARLSLVRVGADMIRQRIAAKNAGAPDPFPVLQVPGPQA